ncbi:MAG TPA: class I SAM-dependent methyltransferase [Spirochaetia bacterium]|nr:class I SAM-dependent methyltransferase [Spirochaetia bacterium]
MEMRQSIQKPMPDLRFRLMALEYRVRARPADVSRELRSLGVEPGMRVLDFGCGPGRYALPAADVVDVTGEVWALDIHPLAIAAVKKGAAARGLANVRTLLSDCATGLPAESMDVVLLFNALHDVDNKAAVLGELRRILKPKGRLLYKDHTLNGHALLSLMRDNDFRPWGRSSVTSFVKC